MPRPRLTAEQATQRLIQGAQANVGRYVAGIQSVTESPMAKAASKAQKAAAGYADAIQSGRWQAGLASSSIEEWRAGAVAGGGSAYTAGIQSKAAKIARKLGPALDQTYAVADSVQAMPTDTIAQRIEKSRAYQQKRYDASRGGGSRGGRM
jgi:hypothetical protein